MHLRAMWGAICPVVSSAGYLSPFRKAAGWAGDSGQRAFGGTPLRNGVLKRHTSVG